MNIVFLGSSAVLLPVKNVILVSENYDFERLLRVDPLTIGVFLCGDRLRGFALVRTLRAGGLTNPLYCMMHGADADHAMVAAILDAGADQVERFPVDGRLFVAQLEAICRRGSGNPDPVINFGNMTYNTTVRELVADGVKVNFTELECRVLGVLIAADGMTLSKADIVDAVYGFDDEAPLPKIVDVVVCKLRRKMIAISGGMDFIMTNWGRGYYFARDGFIPHIRSTAIGPQRFEVGPRRTHGARWARQETAE